MSRIFPGICLLSLCLSCTTSREPEPVAPAGRPTAAASERPADFPAADELDSQLILAGDAGTPLQPILPGLALDLEQFAPVESAVVWLGDNVYPDGVPPLSSGRSQDPARFILRGQISFLAPLAGKILYVPGNHDWAKSGPAGLDHVRAEQALIQEICQAAELCHEAFGPGKALLSPQNGCPGPDVRLLGERVKIVTLDTEWLLGTPGRGLPEDCGMSGDPADPEGWRPAFEAGLAAALDQRDGRLAIVAAHHPLHSHGAHGQGMALNRQNLAHPDYQRMAGWLEELLRRSPPLVYAAGHDHSLQVLEPEGSSTWFLVSGGGGQGLTAVQTGPDTRFAAARHGYMRLLFLKRPTPSRQALLEIVAAPEKGSREAALAEEHRAWLWIPGPSPR